MSPLIPFHILSPHRFKQILVLCHSEGRSQVRLYQRSLSRRSNRSVPLRIGVASPPLILRVKTTGMWSVSVALLFNAFATPPPSCFGCRHRSRLCWVYQDLAKAVRCQHICFFVPYIGFPHFLIYRPTPPIWWFSLRHDCGCPHITLVQWVQCVGLLTPPPMFQNRSGSSPF